MAETLEGRYKYLVFQTEIAESGTQHIQGYVVLKEKTRRSALSKLLEEVHWEIRKGTHQQAKAYCMKPETREVGPVELGDDSDVPTGSGARTDLDDIKEKIKNNVPFQNIAEEHFGSWCRYRQSFSVYANIIKPARNQPPKVKIFWGPTGTGKTTKALEVAGKDAFWLTKPSDSNLWFDGYQTGSNLVIDEFYSWIKYDLLLRILDWSALQVPIKGNFVAFNSPIIVITSNQNPMHWYKKVEDKSALHRRFKDFCEITKLDQLPSPSGNPESAVFDFALNIDEVAEQL